MKIWIARNEDKNLWGHRAKPTKVIGGWISNTPYSKMISFPIDMFPDIKYEDEEPVEADMVEIDD